MTINTPQEGHERLARLLRLNHPHTIELGEGRSAVYRYEDGLTAHVVLDEELRGADSCEWSNIP